MCAGNLLRRLLPVPADGPTRPGRRSARARVLTWSAVASAVALLLTAVWATGRGPVTDYTVGDVVRVGVIEGQSIPGYVRSSRGELDALLAESAPDAAPAQTYALVALEAYLPPDRLVPVLGGAVVSEVFSRVPLPGTQTQIVRIPAFRLPDDVLAGMARVAADKDSEARDYRGRSGALRGDDERERELRRVYDMGAEVAAAEAAAYRSRCSCVYAAVVRAIPAELTQIARRPGVRVVDPAPEVRRLERTVFLPPLPEHADVARPPASGLPTSAGAVPTATAAARSGSSPSPEVTLAVSPAATDVPGAGAASSPSMPGAGSSPAAVSPTTVRAGPSGARR